MKPKKRFIIFTLTMILFFSTGIKAQNKMLIITPDEFVDELQPLTDLRNRSACPRASILFTSGIKIATTANPVHGFSTSGSVASPVYLKDPYTEPYSVHTIRGIRIKSQIRLKNGGAIKLYQLHLGSIRLLRNKIAGC
jgi:hypothetical protein